MSWNRMRSNERLFAFPADVGHVTLADSSVATEERVARLRQRVASGYYEQPHVLEAVARAIIKACPQSSWVARPDSSGRI
jgi:hypothetical protein